MNIRKSLSILLVALCLVASAPANEAPEESLDLTLNLPIDTLEILNQASSQHFRLPGAYSIETVGHPELLTYPALVALPNDRTIDRLEVLKADWRVLPGQFNVRPVAEPLTTQQRFFVPEPVEKNLEIYESDTPYPAWTARLEGHGSMRGVPVARVQIAPLKWNPSTGELSVLSGIELKAHLKKSTLSGTRPVASSDTARQRELAYLARNVINIDAVELPQSTGGSFNEVGLYNPPGLDPLYVIIVPRSDWAAAIQPLADWLTHSGIPADIVTVDWIKATYGQTLPYKIDGPAKVREFLVDAYTQFGIQYALMAGDYLEVPTRDFRSSSASSPPYWWYPTDFYYSDLDVNHNLDGDLFPFERYDDYPAGYVFAEDVYVGRIPARNPQMLTDYLDKWFSYVFAYQKDYQTNILYAADHLYDWQDTAPLYEEQVDPIVNHPPYVVTKLYEEDYPEYNALPLTIQAFIDHVSLGQNLILHAAHCGYWAMDMGDGYFQNGINGDDHVAMLTNLDRYGVMYSLGCNVQPWDYEHSIGEDLVTDPGRGLIASVANSDSGWWTTQMAGITAFAQSVIGDGVVPIGQNMIDAKQFSIWKWNHRPDPPYEDYYSLWGKCSVNLLGEPSMQVWTERPTPLAMASTAFKTGTSTWEVTITITAITPSSTPDSIPVQGAKVCLSGGNVYQIAETNADGVIVFTVEGASARLLNAAATGRNYVPVQKKVGLPSMQIGMK